MNESQSKISNRDLLDMVACNGLWGIGVKLDSLSEDHRNLVAQFNQSVLIDGLTEGEVRVAVRSLVASIPDDLAGRLLRVSDGPRLVQTLSKYPGLLEAFIGLSDSQTEIQIEELRELSLKLKPKTSQTPPPPDPLFGCGEGAPRPQANNEDVARGHDETRVLSIEDEIAFDIYQRMADDPLIEDVQKIGGGGIFEYLSNSNEAELDDGTHYFLPKLSLSKGLYKDVAKRRYSGVVIGHNRSGNVEYLKLRVLVDAFTKRKQDEKERI